MAKKTPRKKPRNSYHHGNLREALLEVATQLIEEEGAANFTLREAARRVGVTHNAPYRHFTDKAELLATLAEHGFHELRERMAQSRNDKSDAIAQLESLAHAYLDFALEKPALFNVMYDLESQQSGESVELPANGVSPSVEDGRAKVMELFSAAIAAAQQSNTVRSGDATRLARTFWSILHGNARLLLDIPHWQKQTAPHQTLDESLQLLWVGMVR